MSLKLETIYNYGGGGGGGYKDGGQLIDAEFIKVENNTISTYDNTARDPVNLYFEVSDGEVLNSVVELTSSVNSTINVYIVKNGFYYLLDNSGGKNVLSGKDYQIIIIGNCYYIEEVNKSNEIDFANIGGTIYPIKNYNGVLWTTENIRHYDSNILFNPGNNTSDPSCWQYENNTKNRVYNFYAAKYLSEKDGWELPKQTDWENLKNDEFPNNSDVIHAKSISGWATPGDNASGFNALPCGYTQAPLGYSTWYNVNTGASFWGIDNPYGTMENFSYEIYNSSFYFGKRDNVYGCSVRFIKRL